MVEGLSPNQSADLIEGRFSVEFSKPQAQAGAGLPAFLARDRFLADAPRTAIALPRGVSPRLTIMEVLKEPIENLMVPLARGVLPSADKKSEAAYIVCTPPSGPPLSENLERWPERTVLELVMRPIAQVLATLQDAGVTHRGIRLDNVFQAAAGQPVTLGAAWASPPAWHQPAISETAYSAMCHHAGRGEGTTADDVYALGVLLLTLALGRVPLATIDDPMIIRMKLDLGSYAALTRDGAPGGILGDLLRSMLADDPDHRPSPKLLLDTAAARGRRVAARPPRRSVRALRVNDIAAFDSRTLAYALAVDDKRSLQLLRSGQVSQWLRRDLGDAALAAQVEDLVRARSAEPRPTIMSDPLMVMQVVTTINPRMPLAWRSILLWPDSMPAMVAEAIDGKRELMVAAEELLTTDVVNRWSTLPAREGRGEAFALSPEVFLHRPALMNHQPGGMLRLFYGLNPTLPCRAKQVADRWIVTVPELVKALEKSAPDNDASIIDMSVAVFIASRGDRRFEAPVSELIVTKDQEEFRRLELKLVCDLQNRYHPSPLPKLARWMAERLRPGLDNWHNRPRREVLSAKLSEVAQSGILFRLMSLMLDESALAADQIGMLRALDEVHRINAELEAIDKHTKLRLSYAERAGQAIAGGLGLAALILCALMAVVP